MRKLIGNTCATIAGIIFFQLSSMEQPIVVACNFDALSKNAETSSIVSNAVISAKQILSCFYWSHITPWRICSTLTHMQKRGATIAATTPGITNTIKKLFTELEEDQYGKFTDTAITCFNEMGVNPVPDSQSLALLREMKQYNIPTIGMGNQDSLEHEIYARKMQQEHNIDLYTLFDGVVTIATLDEQTNFDLEPGDCFLRHQINPRWFIARNAAPSTSFTNTLKIIARDLANNASVWSVENKEQLAVVVNALHKVFQQRTPSPESGILFGHIMEESNLMLSPTRE